MSRIKQGKFVAKLLKYIILFQDIVTFIGLDYRDASLITSYLVVILISILKNQMNRIICCQNVLNGRTDFLVTTIELLRFLSRT